jgi:arylsulfatase A-like enzyme
MFMRGFDRNGGRGPLRAAMAILAAGAAALLLATGPRASGNDAAADPGAGPKTDLRQRTNVVVILADDLGYGDAGCQGARDVKTPNIDAIAAAGVRFTSGYVSCPVCSPSRCGLMTGRYQERSGHEFNPGPTPGPEFGLAADETTLAERLKAAGYATGIVGKWHLGVKPECTPTHRGFDEFFGFLGAAHKYVGKGAQGNSILRGEQPVDEPEYLTDAFTREAVSFIDRHKDGPFFLYLPYNAVHAPLSVSERYVAKFANIPDPKRRTFATMLAALDEGVGSVMAALRKDGLEERTLVFFLSDNGGPTGQTTSRNDPLSGGKAQVLEGGIRIPFMAQWKGTIPAGRVFAEPVISLDIHATALAVAGVATPTAKPLDGVDLLPYVRGERAGAPHEALFWRFGAQSAVRMGRYKLTHRLGRERLVDLEADIREENDLLAEKPAVAAQLRAALEKWEGELQAPRWVGGMGSDRPARKGKAPAKAKPKDDDEE